MFVNELSAVREHTRGVRGTVGSSCQERKSESEKWELSCSIWLVHLARLPLTLLNDELFPRHYCSPVPRKPCVSAGNLCRFLKGRKRGHWALSALLLQEVLWLFRHIIWGGASRSELPNVVDLQCSPLSASKIQETETV